MRPFGRLTFLAIIPLLALPLYGWWEWSKLQVDDFDPDTASMKEMFLGLCGFDVSTRESEFQNNLYRRCRAELGSKSEPETWQEIDAGLARLGESRRGIWRANVEWYCRRWWRAETEAYHAVAVGERTAYVKNRLREIALAEASMLRRLWRTTETSPSLTAGNDFATRGTDFATRLSASIETWIAAATPDEQPAMREFWNQLRFQLLIDPQLWTLFRAEDA